MVNTMVIILPKSRTIPKSVIRKTVDEDIFTRNEGRHLTLEIRYVLYSLEMLVLIFNSRCLDPRIFRNIILLVVCNDPHLGPSAEK